MTFDLPFAIEIVLRRPEFLWIISALPLLWVLVLWEGRQRKEVLRDPWVALHFFPVRSMLRFLWWVGMSAVIVLLACALAVPERKVINWQKIFGMVRITFLIDASLSTALAEDVEPNRLAAEKELIQDFVNLLWFDQKLKGNYAVALIPFAGAAQPFYSPFTVSREQTILNLESINEKTITRKGTSLWAALRAYDELLLWRPAEQKDTVDLAILISDGGKEEGRGTERSVISALLKEILDPYRAMLMMKDVRILARSSERMRRVVVNTVGVGSVELDAAGNRVSMPVPLIIRDRAGNFFDYYREDPKDPKRPILYSWLDEEILKDIAEMGGGAYAHFSDKEKILHEFKTLVFDHRQETGKVPDAWYDSMRVWFLVPAFCLCFILFGYSEPFLRLFKKRAL